MSKNDDEKLKLFLELAKPDENGHSRWVRVDEFKDKYASLSLGNGLSWGRKNSTLDRTYIIEKCRDLTKGNRIDAIKLSGFNPNSSFNQTIRADIKQHFKHAKCVMLGVRGTSVNTKIEIDHKDGRKNDERISNVKEQKITDFQPLCKAANDAKRQICKRCKETDKRWDAKNILGNPFSFYAGGEKYEGTCVGCYQYDPVAYRCTTCKKLIEMTSANLLKEIYKDLPDNLLDELLK